MTAPLPDCPSCYPGCTAVCPAPRGPWRTADSIFVALQDRRLAVFAQSLDTDPEVNKSSGLKQYVYGLCRSNRQIWKLLLPLKEFALIAPWSFWLTGASLLKKKSSVSICSCNAIFYNVFIWLQGYPRVCQICIWFFLFYSISLLARIRHQVSISETTTRLCIIQLLGCILET